jgi:hypothetical protein
MAMENKHDEMVKRNFFCMQMRLFNALMKSTMIGGSFPVFDTKTKSNDVGQIVSHDGNMGVVRKFSFIHLKFVRLSFPFV